MPLSQCSRRCGKTPTSASPAGPTCYRWISCSRRHFSSRPAAVSFTPHKACWGGRVMGKNKCLLLLLINNIQLELCARKRESVAEKVPRCRIELLLLSRDLLQTPLVSIWVPDVSGSCICSLSIPGIGCNSVNKLASTPS